MKFALIVFLGLLVSACQTVPYQGKARNVKLKPKKEGIISIPVEYRDEDRQKADKVMTRNCNPLLPEITEEGEVAIGTKTNSSGRTTDRESSERKVGSLFGLDVLSGTAGGQDKSSSSTTTQLKEWHIAYKCKKGRKSTVQ